MNVDNILSALNADKVDYLLMSGAGSMSDDSIKHREEIKRDRADDPVQRWLHIQATITWGEANMPYAMRRNRPRTHPRPATSPGQVPPPGRSS